MYTSKIAGLGLTALKSNFMKLERPYKLTFSITYGCQSRCLTCNIWQIKPKGELELHEIQEFASKNPHFKWIEITGGEPFLRSDIVEIVKAFKETSKGLYIVTMPTNSLSNHDMLINRITQVLQTGIPRLSITLSLDGYRELHDKIRGIPGNFDRVMDMYKRLSELRMLYPNLFFVFGYTMSRYNQGMFEKTYSSVKELFPEVTYNNFHLNVAQISDSYYQNGEMDIRPDKEALIREINSVLGKRHVEIGAIPIVEGAFLRKLVQYIKTGKNPVKSRSLDASLFMDSYGNVYPSIMWGRVIGNIRKTGFDLGPIWSSAEADEVRKLIKEGKEPSSWTACEAYQSLVGSIGSLL
jgi:MoaA/NifB/PqqE/SkfB family radical SAM enzyme